MSDADVPERADRTSDRAPSPADGATPAWAAFRRPVAAPGHAPLDADVALRFAAEVRALLSADREPEALLEALGARALPALGDICVIEIDHPMLGRPRFISSVLPPAADACARAYLTTHAPTIGFDDPALRAGETRFFTYADPSPPARGDPAAASVAPLGIMVVPMRARGALVGLMKFITTTHSGREPTDAHAALATELASQAAYALEHACLLRALRQELEERRQAEATLREREAQLRGFFDAPASLLCIFALDDASGDVVFQRPSAALAAAYGTTVEALTGRTMRGLGVSEARLARVYAHFRRCRDTGIPVGFDLEAQVRSPIDRGAGALELPSLRCLASRIGDDPRQATIAGLAFDTTELLQSQAELRGFFDAPGTGMLVEELDDAARDMIIRRANPTAATFLGVPAPELVGRSLRSLGVPPADVDALYVRYERCRRTGVPELFELPGVPSAGLPPAQLSVRRIGSDPLTSCLAVTVTDLTERRRLAALFEGFFDAPGTAMTVASADDARRDVVIHTANRTFAEFHGRSREWLVGRTGRDLGVPEERVAQLYELYRRVRDTGEPTVFEFESASVPGRWLLGSLRRIGTDAAPDARIAGLFTDVTALRAAHLQLEGFFAAPGVALAILDADEAARDVVITRPNAAFAAMYGMTPAQLAGMGLRAVTGDPARVEERLALIEECRRTGEPVLQEVTLELPIGTRTALLSLHRIGPRAEGSSVACVAVDVTALRQLQAEFFQAQKMEAVGQLAGGIAHDFNNVLAVIHAVTETLLGGEGSEADRREDLLEVRRAVDRAGQLTRQLLTFSRRGSTERVPVGIDDVVRETVPMLERLLAASNVVLSCELASGLPPVLADRGQLGQVLMNLVLNARDAMPDGGRVRVTVRRLSADALPAGPPVRGIVPRAARAAPAGYCALVVADTGVGMSETVRARVFEPFFTTKTPERGTGLGLSTVRTIVEESGGRVWVDSAPGAGAVFTVALPALAAPGAPITAEGEETLLLVDADAAVRLFSARALRARGYRVLEAASDEEAVAVVDTLDGPLHALVTGLTSSGGSGPVLRASLAARGRTVPVVHTTGAATADGPDAPRVARPFTSEQLAHAVRDALDGDGEAAPAHAALDASERALREAERRRS